jgi:rare lipoprotein A
MPHAKFSNRHRALALVPVQRRHGKVLALLLALPLTTPLGALARDGSFPIAPSVPVAVADGAAAPETGADDADDRLAVRERASAWVRQASDALAPVLATPGKLIAQGRASWYGHGFHGRRTASGDIFDMHGLTAAHRTLPFGTRLRVRSVATGKEVVVRVTDRGPFVHQRIIDLSLGAARALGVHHRGVTEVQLIKE